MIFSTQCNITISSVPGHHLRVFISTGAKYLFTPFEIQNFRSTSPQCLKFSFINIFIQASPSSVHWMVKIVGKGGLSGIIANMNCHTLLWDCYQKRLEWFHWIQFYWTPCIILSIQSWPWLLLGWTIHIKILQLISKGPA